MDKSLDAILAEENLQEPVDTGATQRVRIDNMGGPATAAPAVPRRPRPAPAQSQKKNWWTRMSRKDRTTIIALGAVAAVLLVSILIAMLFIDKETPDDGRILSNVYVAGIHLGGMDQQQAEDALNEIAKNYDDLDMVIKVLDTEIRLTPGATGANLDVSAAVKAALAYGRDGDKTPNQATHTVSILPYLNLNTDYIRQQVDTLGEQYSSLRSDPTVRIEGTAPPAKQETYDLNQVYQTLYLFTGTAEYVFSADDLYQQILDAYDSNVFEVVGNCTVNPPKISAVDLLEQAYQTNCWPSVDASIDASYNVTPEVYGYGFDLDAVKDQLASAAYGQTIEVPLRYIKPSITEADISGNLFQNILGTYQQSVEANNNLVSNIRQVLKSLNGLILKSGDTFSFNTLVGNVTQAAGYKPYSQYVGTTYTPDVIGGGISQVASALYACAIQSDLEIIERHAHAYAPSFTQPGLDADILQGSMDLRFKNNTTAPIRISAEYLDGKLTVSFIGTDTRSYTVELLVVTDKVYTPVILLQTMPEGNVGGYKDGDVLQTGITGYLVSVYKHCTYLPTPEDPENPTPANPTEDPAEELVPFDIPVGQSLYAKQNIVQVEIYVPPVTTPPTEATDPDGSTDTSTETTGPETSVPDESTGVPESTGNN